MQKPISNTVKEGSWKLGDGSWELGEYRWRMAD